MGTKKIQPLSPAGYDWLAWEGQWMVAGQITAWNSNWSHGSAGARIDRQGGRGTIAPCRFMNYEIPIYPTRRWCGLLGGKSVSTPLFLFASILLFLMDRFISEEPRNACVHEGTAETGSPAWHRAYSVELGYPRHI